MKSVEILVAEDDPSIRNALVDLLESEGYGVTATADGDRCWTAFRQGRFQLAILDIMMPGRSGFEVCRAIRRVDGTIPILFLTAKGEEIDKVLGLELGGDDYLTKPFGVRELLARIHALLRRSRHGEAKVTDLGALPDTFQFAAAHIDRHAYRAQIDHHPAQALTAREMKLLEVFHRHPGEALNRDQLLNAAWGIDYLGTTRTLDQHVAQLRKKAERDPASPRHLLTVHGVGYRYVPLGEPFHG